MEMSKGKNVYLKNCAILEFPFYVLDQVLY